MTPRRVAWLVWIASMVLTSAYLLINMFGTQGKDPGEYVFVLLGVLLYATVGALITSRQPESRVGLLFAGVGAAAALSTAPGAHAELAHLHALPGLQAAAWVSRVAFAAMLGPIAFLLLIQRSLPVEVVA